MYIGILWVEYDNHETIISDEGLDAGGGGVVPNSVFNKIIGADSCFGKWNIIVIQ